MTPSILDLSISSYGGLPIVFTINVCQVALVAWVARERWRARQEAAGPERTARAIARAAAWRGQVKPWIVTLMLLGPGTGLGFSTLLGALGMAGLGEAMTAQGSQTELLEAMAHAYAEISIAYLLMVGGTPPMLLGPLAMVAGRRLEQEVDETQGDPDEQLLFAVEGLRQALDEQTRQAARHHERLELLLGGRARVTVEEPWAS